MTQKQIDNLKIVLSYHEKLHHLLQNFLPINTNDKIDFKIAPNKIVKCYYSKCYKSKVLSIQYNSSKKLIITKSMWKIFKKYLNQINNELY